MLAASEKRYVKVVDVKSAYLQAPMPKDKDNVYIRLDKISSDILYRVDPSYLAYQRLDGTMILIRGAVVQSYKDHTTAGGIRGEP